MEKIELQIGLRLAEGIVEERLENICIQKTFCLRKSAAGHKIGKERFLDFSSCAAMGNRIRRKRGERDRLGIIMEETEKKRSSVNLLEGPIFRSIVLFAIPILVSNLFQSFYNMMDTMIV